MSSRPLIESSVVASVVVMTVLLMIVLFCVRAGYSTYSPDDFCCSLHDEITSCSVVVLLLLDELNECIER